MNKNVNRDYLVKVDIKSVEAIPPREDLRFYMTDVWTSNIFFQLVFEDSGNSLINSYAPVENAESYSITLRVVKPNNKALTIDAVPLSQGSSFFVADLTSDFIDVPGICKCELFIDTNINGRLERYTTNMFEYEVKYSIFYDLEELLGRSEYISIENVVTKDYMEAFIRGNFTLDGYVTDEELSSALANKSNINHTHSEYANKAHTHTEYANKTHTHSEYATNEYVNSEIAKIQTTGSGATSIKVNGNTYAPVDGLITLPNYPTVGEGGQLVYDDTELRNLINTKADKTHTHTEYVTQTDLDNAIAGVTGGNGGNADTIDGLHIWTGTLAEFDALGTKQNNTVYIIKE